MKNTTNAVDGCLPDRILTGCTSEEMDYNNPDVALFVKQLKSGTYKMKNEKGWWRFLISRKRISPNF